MTLKVAREVVEKELIQRVLAKHGGNITKTAGELGVSRPTMHDLVFRYDIPRKMPLKPAESESKKLFEVRPSSVPRET